MRGRFSPLNAVLPLIAASCLAMSGAAAAGEAAQPEWMQAFRVRPHQSCFLDRIDHPQAQRIMQAIVFIAQVTPGGELLSFGSGFIAAGTDRQIVTAGHVVEDPPPANSSFVAFFSDGSAIGTLGVARAAKPIDQYFHALNFAAGDVAILRLEKFANAGVEQRFAEVEGLAIASLSEPYVGITEGEIGAAWGFSGAPAIDTEGNVVGIVTDADFKGRKAVEIGWMPYSNQYRMPVTERRVLPSRSLAIIEPIDFSPARAPDRPMAGARILAAGFPLAVCGALEATIQPMKSEPGIELIRTWRRTDDARWYLQPQMRTVHLNLTD